MRTWCLLLAAVLLSACGHVEPSLHGGRLKDSWSNPSSRRYLRVRGIGSTSTDIEDDVRRRAESREAALASARKELLSLIGGLRLAGGITVRDAMVVDSELRSTVDRLVFGSEEYRTEWTESGACVVTLQVERSTVKKMVEGIKPKDLPAPLPEPTRRFWKAESQKDVKWTRADVADRKSVLAGVPKTLVVGGLLVPGWAQIFAGQELEGDESMKLTLRGIGVMGGTLGLLAIGLDNLPHKPTGGNGTASSTNTKDNRGVGYACLAGAAVLHVLGIVDGYHSLRRTSIWFSVIPQGGGARFIAGMRF